ANFVAAHGSTDFDDAADEFVADDQAWLDRALRPLIPEIDVQVGAADRGLLEFDENVIRPDLGQRNLLHPDSLFRSALDQCLHRVGHDMNPGSQPPLYGQPTPDRSVDQETGNWVGVSAVARPSNSRSEEH